MKPQTYFNAMTQAQARAYGGNGWKYGPYADRAERGLRAALIRQDAKLDALRGRAAEWEAVLRKVEWVDTAHTVELRCPCCMHGQRYGHVDCDLSLVLHGTADVFAETEAK